MIKAVIFDMFETLVTLFTGRTYFSEHIAADLNQPIEAFRKCWHETEKDRTLGKYSMEEGLAITLKNLGAYSAANIELICHKRREALGDTFKAIPPESLWLLQTLHEKGFKTGLITNTFSDERDMILASPLYPLFDAAMISYEQGLSKPDPEIYRRALQALNVTPEECLYVGDGGSHELQAARSLGMQAVQCTWFHDRAYEPHIPCPLLPDFPHADTREDIIKYLETQKS
jgi:putative hydrolase of the HAD superfamily